MAGMTTRKPIVRSATAISTMLSPFLFALMKGLYAKSLYPSSFFTLVPLAYLVKARLPSIRYVTVTSGKVLVGC
jgi:hypothetical protein